ncbi:Death domain-containing adapter protein BG4 [Lucilia cuprina]|uniref:Death domain-containing adapter protein BG4 n=1 Tax=Lucilia cuprina TaxID=7375 RepID=A0A0L0CPL0_LUCCU|nr:Fas-associated death domain protein [Lucilia cuprina]KNC34313.1 Death domain-containing adapter protein BG4 [Lucilia cuprina]
MGQPLTFETLKRIAANDPTAQENLEDLKYMFRSDIGSARNMYRIHTMDDLIDCLERHDALSEFNIEPFREIADEYGGALAAVIMNYHVPKELLTAEPYNEYRELRLSHECATRLNISGSLNGSHSGLNVNEPNVNASPVNNNKSQQATFVAQVPTKEKRAAIYKLIASEIGTDWRCLGRELDICQGEMDNVEIQYRDLKTRVYKLFQIFEEDDSIDPKKHVLIICQALDQCRRKDLRRKVERIMSH